MPSWFGLLGSSRSTLFIAAGHVCVCVNVCPCLPSVSNCDMPCEGDSMCMHGQFEQQPCSSMFIHVQNVQYVQCSLCFGW